MYDDDEDAADARVIASLDPIVGRADALIRLAAAVEMTTHRTARSILIAYMGKVYNTVTIPSAEVQEFPRVVQ